MVREDQQGSPTKIVRILVVTLLGGGTLLLTHLLS